MTTDEVALKVIAILKTLSGRKDFQPTMTFLELGLDSLKTMDLILNLEETFSIEIPEQMLTSEHLGTPDAVIKMIRVLINS